VLLSVVSVPSVGNEAEAYSNEEASTERLLCALVSGGKGEVEKLASLSACWALPSLNLTQLDFNNVLTIILAILEDGA